MQRELGVWRLGLHGLLFLFGYVDVNQCNWGYCRRDFQTKTIPVGKLLLDTENPRHEKVASQKDAISALIASERQKLVVLASDVLEFGLSPIDRLLVIKAGRNFTVVEGNRRLAVVKILGNPGLAEGTSIESQMKRLSANGVVPIEADCAIAPARKDARHWMENRHGGESGGAGVVPWNAFAANRFAQKPGREAGAAIRFLEEIEGAYPKNEVLQDLIRLVAQKRLTTLGRLVLDPSFKDRAGMVDAKGSLSFHFSASELEDFFEHVLGDFAANVGVSEIRKKPQRAAYLKTTPEPDPKKRTSEASALSATSTAKTKPKPKRPKPASKPPMPFKDLDLSSLDSKTQALLREFRTLKMDKTPHATAVLMRAILELAIEEYIKTKNLQRSKELKKRVKVCLTKLDPTHKEKRFQAVRTGLEDGTSLYAVQTLHGLVHNPHFHADALTLGNIAASMEPFLQALNDDA